MLFSALGWKHTCFGHLRLWKRAQWGKKRTGKLGLLQEGIPLRTAFQPPSTGNRSTDKMLTQLLPSTTFVTLLWWCSYHSSQPLPDIRSAASPSCRHKGSHGGNAVPKSTSKFAAKQRLGGGSPVFPASHRTSSAVFPSDRNVQPQTGWAKRGLVRNWVKDQTAEACWISTIKIIF